MININGKAFKTMNLIADYLTLNIIWLFFSLPLITIGPSTAALFAVIRDWSLEKDISIVKSFLKYFKVNFKNSILFELIVFIYCATLIFVINSDVYNIIPIQVKIILFLSYVFIGVCILFIGAFYFSIIVHFEFNFLESLKYSLSLSIYNFFSSFLITILWGFTIYLILDFSFLIVILVSVTAYMNFYFCFRKLSERS